MQIVILDSKNIINHTTSAYHNVEKETISFVIEDEEYILNYGKNAFFSKKNKDYNLHINPSNANIIIHDLNSKTTLETKIWNLNKVNDYINLTYKIESQENPISIKINL